MKNINNKYLLIIVFIYMINMKGKNNGEIMNVVISGASGVGKGTIIKKILDDKIGVKNISYTTRNIRKGEKDGRDYNFINEKTFKLLEKNNYFFETIEYAGNLYGIPFINSNETSNNIVFYDVVASSGLNLKKYYNDTILIYLLPPNLEELNKRRGNRGNNRIFDDSVEFKNIIDYDYIIINDNIEKTYKEILSIIKINMKYSIRNNMNIINQFNTDLSFAKKLVM